MPRKLSSLVGRVGAVEAIPTIVERAQAAPSNEEREAALVDGLLGHGTDFVAEVIALDEALGDEALALLARWLEGETLTNRADEAELRARAGQRFLERTSRFPLPESVGSEPGDFGRVVEALARAAEPEVLRLAAVSVLSLPKRHLERDVDRARTYLFAARRGAVEAGDPGSDLRGIVNLLDFDLVDAESGEWLIDHGLATTAEADEDVRSRLLLAAESFAHRRAIELREAGDEAGAERWLRRVGELIRAAYSGEAEESVAALAARAGEHDARGEYRAAAELYARVVGAADPVSPTAAPVVARYGEVLLHLDEFGRAAAAMAPALDTLTESYVTAVLPEQVADTGDWLTRGATALAVAYAGTGEWGAALEAVDRAKSLRLRYQAVVRRMPAARELLPIERALDSARRGLGLAAELEGVTDETGGEALVATVEGRLLEVYRRARPVLAPGLLHGPSATEVAGLLHDDEAVVALALHWKGTVVACVTPDRNVGELCVDWPQSRWFGLFTGEDGHGWLAALVSRGGLDRARALGDFLSAVDELGSRIAGLLPADVRRLVIIPHSLLHLVPFWAVPSLARFDTLIASSAAQLADSRRRGPGRLAGEALVVSNPTLDLPVSAVEARSAERHLATIGVRPNELAGLAAVERSAADGLARATALHFTGHGLSDFAEPIRSGLLLHPGEEWAATPDPFADLVTDDLVWEDEEEPTFDEERWADVPGVGRLYEIVDEERLERRLEREEGTLVAAYAGGTLLRVGELWSAGDLMLEQQADGCALAFLSACESGMAGGRRIDEYGGLPAALQLAGVRTLVSSLWPVSEALTAVYVELFYRELCDREGAVDVTAVVRRVRERLTEMSRDGVLELIASLRRSTDGVAARLTLDAFAAEIRQRGDSPFTDAWELAPFYVTGEGRVVLGGADADA